MRDKSRSIAECLREMTVRAVEARASADDCKATGADPYQHGVCAGGHYAHLADLKLAVEMVRGIRICASCGTVTCEGCSLKSPRGNWHMEDSDLTALLVRAEGKE